MSLDTNPFDQFDVHDEHHAPARLPAQSPNNQGAVGQTAPDPFAQFDGQATQQPQGDQSTTVGDQMQGGFADSHPDTPKSKLSPDDEAHYAALLHTGSASDITRFLTAKGYSTDPDWLAKFIQARDNRKANGGGVNYGISYGYPTPAGDPDPSANAKGVQEALTAPVHGLLENIPGFNHAAALGRTIDNEIKGRAGDRSFGQEYNYQDDLQHGQVASEEENHPYTRVAGQLLGGLAIPSGLEGVGLTAGTDVLKAGGSMADARAAVKIAVRNRMAVGGGIYGAAHGALKADTPGEAVTGALTEAGLGAATGAVLPHLGGAVETAAKPFRSASDLVTGNMNGRMPNEALQPFVDENVRPLAADVGGIFSRMATGTTNMTLGGIPLADAAHKSIDDAQQLKSLIADRIGVASRDVSGRSDSVGAGLTAQRGVQATLGENGPKQAVADKLYNAIPIPGNADATITNTRNALAALNHGLESNQELSALISDPRLTAYERAFTGKTTAVPTGILDASGQPVTRAVVQGGKLNWQDLKNFRSYVGELAGRQTLQDSTSKNALQALYAGLSEDMRATAATVSPSALAKFTRANNYYRAFQNRKDQVLKPLLGNDLSASGEDAFRQIQRWSTNNGDVFALGRTLRSMRPDEANSVRATIFDRLGGVTNGRQDASGVVWSPNDFMTHWSGLSSRAKSVLFPGAEYRNSIDNLVRIASSAKAAQAYANVSKTGNAVNGAALLTGFFTNPLATLPVALGQIGAGKILASPRFARWLGSSVGKPNPSAALAHINRLSSIARAEPAIANEVLQLQQRLASAFTGGGESMPTRLAAQPPGNEPTNEPDGGQGNASDQQPQNQSLQP